MNSSGSSHAPEPGSQPSARTVTGAAYLMLSTALMLLARARRARAMRHMLVAQVSVLALLVPLATASAQGLAPSRVGIATAETHTERIAGTNRYGTAAAVADRWAPGVDVVYVTSGEDFPDALVAAARAGVHDAPVLLAKADAIPAETQRALRRLAPARIVVVGGPRAVSDSVVQVLRPYATTQVVDRVGGENRYAAAAAMGGLYEVRPAKVYLASGEDFPDALSAAALAGHESAPLLLTKAGELPSHTVAQLERLSAKEVVVVGGPLTVSDSVARQAAAYTELKTPRRLAGVDRYHTAAKIAAEYPAGVSPAFLASGADFPDGLVGAALAARTGAPLVLTPGEKVHAGTVKALTDQRPTDMYVLGGVNTISDTTVGQLAEVLQSGPSGVVWPATSSRVDSTGVSIPGVKYLFSASTTERNKVLDDVAGLGVGWVRFDVPLFMVENRQGTRDWTKVDAIVAAARQRDLKVLVTLTAVPAWTRTDASTSAGFEDWQEGARTDTQKRAFRDFAKAAAARYDGSVAGRKVDVWELWNEPNLKAFWAPTPSTTDYADLVRLAYPAMREVTTAPIIAGGTGGTSGSAPNIRTTDWYQQLHAKGANKYWDAATIHPYQDLGWARGGELFRGGEYGQLGAVRAAQVAAGDSAKTIWGTEFGWDATPSGVPGGVSGSRASFAEQAAWLAPTLDDWYKRSYTGVNFQYHLYDYTSSSGRFRGYGVFNENGTKKEALYRAWTSWLSAR